MTASSSSTTTTATASTATATATATTTQPHIIQWIVDTRDLWPEAEKTAQLETVAARALALLTPDERKAVLRYLFVRDAKMSLASQLLKHYVISRTCDVAWWDTKITRNAKTKPVYVDPATGTSPIEFNVSHQAGLVALVAAHGYADDDGQRQGVDVGVDIVCVDERAERDHAMIAREGWPAFVDMHADVFAPGEASYLKYQILSAIPGTVWAGATSREITDIKLRFFYTLWCLREAYVKMTGEALLAPWLKVLEFRAFQPPKPQQTVASGGAAARADGEDVIRNLEIWFEAKRVEDANVCLRALGPNYMTCTAVRTPRHQDIGLALELGPYKVVALDEIVEYAESRI